MAVAALTVCIPKLQPRQTFDPKPFFTTEIISSSLSDSSCYCSAKKDNSKISIVSASATKKRVFDLGIGLFAASLMALSPLDANATRIEYYATVGEPLCELNFVRSGLGYCDVSVGSGEEAPYAELIDVSFSFQGYIRFALFLGLRFCCCCELV